MTCHAHGLAASRRFLVAADVDLIRSLAALLEPPANVADIGAGSGTTALAVFASAPLETTVTTIDDNVDALNWAEKAVANAGYASHWHGVVEDSVAAANLYGQQSTDLILIDTSHTYDRTKAELTAWLPKLRRGGWLWLHDYDGEDYPGVRRAASEVTVYFRDIYTAGLGWAGRKR